MDKQLELFSESHKKWENELDLVVSRSVDFKTLSGE